MKDNKNIDFLNSIYKIVEMGVVGINDVIDKVRQADFKNFLENQRKEYDEILNEAETIFTSYGAKEKELPKMVKVNSKVMCEVHLMKNHDDKTIASMMAKGTTTGIEKITNAMNTYNNEDQQAVKLAEKLLASLQNNMEGLKKYL